MAGAGEKNTVLMENVRLIFRNFEGRGDKYNKEGARNFGVILPEDVAQQMERDGWPVKRLRPSEEEQEQGIEVGPPWVPVKVAYDRGRPPRIITITSRGRTNITEDTVKSLDNINMANVDLIVGPYHWDVNGKQGISVYLQTMYVTVEEDELDRKYAELEEAQQR
jgi:hypothetical protein